MIAARSCSVIDGMENADIIQDDQISFGEDFNTVPEGISFRPNEDLKPGVCKTVDVKRATVRNTVKCIQLGPSRSQETGPFDTVPFFCANELVCESESVQLGLFSAGQ